MRLRLALAVLLAVVAAAPVLIGAWWVAGRIEQRAVDGARDRVDATASAVSSHAVEVETQTREGAHELAAALERGVIVAPDLEPGGRDAERMRRLADSDGAWAVRGMYAADGRWVGGHPRMPEVDRAALSAMTDRCVAGWSQTRASALERAYLVCGARLAGGELALVGQPLAALLTREEGTDDEVRLAVVSPGAEGAAEERRIARTLVDARGEPFAAIVVSARIAREQAIAAELRRVSPLLAGAAALLALLAGLVLGGRVQRPLRELRDAADRIGRGDLEITLQPSRSGASGTYSAFNRMARDLQHAQSRAKRAERVAAWRDIARRIAHEIKNPLTPIRMSMETMRRTKQRQHPDFDEIFEESTRTVLEEVERLERIVTEFSRFARLPRPRPTALDVREVVTQVVQLHAGVLAPEGPYGSARSGRAEREPLHAPGGDSTISDVSPRVSIEMTFAEDLPKVRADRDQLTQVLVNLIQNALDAAESKRGERGHVEVEVERTLEGGVRVTVADDGPGIPEDERVRVLEPYYTTKARGTGLGLAIVDRIVSEHGGFLEIDESPRGGAAISITLTREGPSEDADASQTS